MQIVQDLPAKNLILSVFFLPNYTKIALMGKLKNMAYLKYYLIIMLYICWLFGEL